MVYRPSHFDWSDRAECHAFMRAESFAVLTSARADGVPVATHLPLWLAAEEGALGTLYGHFARANDHWQLADGTRPALAVFAGPHAYISPRWYPTPNMVPTWNYVTVHATGRPQIIEDDAGKREVLRRLTDFYEQGQWSVDGLPAQVVAGALKGIVAFRLPIERLEGKAKLSQNRTAADQAGAIAGLEARPDDPGALAIARLMRRLPA